MSPMSHFSYMEDISHVSYLSDIPHVSHLSHFSVALTMTAERA